MTQLTRSWLKDGTYDGEQEYWATTGPVPFGKIVWGIPVFIFFFSLYLSASGHPDARLSWWAMLASIPSVICMQLVGYRLTSPVVLVSSSFLAYYSIAVVLNFLSPEIAVPASQWETTDLAMMGAAVGCLSMAGGILSFRVFHGIQGVGPENLRRCCLVKPIAMLPFVAVLIVFGVAYYASGAADVYFMKSHAEILEQVESTTPFHNIMGMARTIFTVAIFLMCFRWLHTRQNSDWWILILLILSPLILIAPSGSRGTSYGFAPYLALFYLQCHRNKWRATKTVAVCILALVILSSMISRFRTMDVIDFSFTEKWAKIWEQMYLDSGHGESRSTMYDTAARLSCYHLTGLIIEMTPVPMPFRGFDGLEDLWMMVVPKIIFRDRPAFTEPVDISRSYGVGSDTTSEPPTLVGDLYRRWGWSGVMAGMGMVGFLLPWIGGIQAKGWSTRVIAFYALSAAQFDHLYAVSVFIWVISFLRELPLAWILSVIIAKILDNYFGDICVQDQR